MTSSDNEPQEIVAKTLAPLPSAYAFVVQFARETDAGGGTFVGQVEHLASARQGRFSTRDELFAWIVEILAVAEAGSLVRE